MKSISKRIKVTIITTFVFCALFSLNSSVLAQTFIPLPQINARFSNPQFNSGTRMYYLDVELNSSGASEFLFGMNVRFLYDASLLEFRYFDQYSDGYGPLGDPVVLLANGASGSQMFSLKAAALVNGTIQLQNPNFQLGIVPNNWVKAFRACFKVPVSVSGKSPFCPSVLWDIKPKVGGGFLTGDDGLIITIVEKDPNTPDLSAPVSVDGANLNWVQNSIMGLPYGKPVSTTCISLLKLGMRVDENPGAHNEYELFQNEPNPFDHGTVIEFILPAAQQVALNFYDVSGKILKELKGEYKEGRNAVNLVSEPWMQGAKVVFYRMETEGFRSKMFKMVFINE